MHLFGIPDRAVTLFGQGNTAQPRNMKIYREVMSSKNILDVDQYTIRFSSFEHRWGCMFGSCVSWYNVTAFILNLQTGKQEFLTAVETAVAIQDENTPIDWDPHNSGYYRYYKDVDTFYIGAGKKDGHDPDYWGLAKCYFPNQEIIAWRWHTHA